jgi:AraC-like DNA-binding protein
MKGNYITDNITTVEQLNKAFESIFKGSTFECKSFDNSISSIGEGIVTEDFFTGNFIGDNISSIRGTNLNDFVISMPRLGHFDTTVANKTIYNKAHETGNILIAVDEALYNNPSKLVNNYMVIINYHELMNMLENKFGIRQLSGYLREIHLADEKVKALFYYIGSTIHVVKTFQSLRESLVAKMNIKEITLLMATDLMGELLQRKSLLNESPDKNLVLKAEEIMESQCENITTIQEISDKVYTSPRNLQKAFKKYRNYTPLQFLKDQKLLKAHQLLKDPYIPATIKNVAIGVGIFDINRFGKYYFDRFGEFPSDTLKKKGNL